MQLSILKLIHMPDNRYPKRSLYSEQFLCNHVYAYAMALSEIIRWDVCQFGSSYAASLRCGVCKLFLHTYGVFGVFVLGPRQNDHHFANDLIKRISLDESLK